MNVARGGRSSRTYWTEGLWAKLVDHAKPGDWVLIQFAHNDATAVDSPKARGSLPGLGEETVTVLNALTGKEEVVHTFGWYVRRMVADAKANKLRPVLLSPTLHNSWQDGTIGHSPEHYADWMRALAAELEIPFIDLSTHAQPIFQELGPKRTGALYEGKTHLKAGAAEIYARLTIEGLIEIDGASLESYLLPDKEAAD